MIRKCDEPCILVCGIMLRFNRHVVNIALTEIRAADYGIFRAAGSPSGDPAGTKLLQGRQQR
jgi:hypothetical protein